MEPVTPPPAPGAPPDVSLPPAPPPAAPPAVVPAYVPPTPPISYEAGGQAGAKGNAVSRFFENVSFTDVGMLVITSCAVFLVVDYYRKRIKYLREEETRIANKMDELSANVQNFIGQNHKSFS